MQPNDSPQNSKSTPGPAVVKFFNYAAQDILKNKDPEKRKMDTAAIMKMADQYDLSGATPGTQEIKQHLLKVMNWGAQLPVTGLEMLGEGARKVINPKGQPIITPEEMKAAANPLSTQLPPGGEEALARAGMSGETPVKDVPPFLLPGGLMTKAALQIGEKIFPGNTISNYSARKAAGFVADVAPSVLMSEFLGNRLARGNLDLKGMTAEQARQAVQDRIAAIKAGGSPTGVSTLEKIGAAALDPMGTGIPMASRALYRSTLSKADKAALEATGQRFSDVLRNAGGWGGSESLQNTISDELKNQGKNVSDKLNKLTEMSSPGVLESDIFNPMYENLGGQAAGGNAPEAAKARKLIQKEQEMRRSFSPNQFDTGGIQWGPNKESAFPKGSTPTEDIIGPLNAQKIKQDFQAKARQYNAYEQSPFPEKDTKVQNQVYGGAYKSGAAAARGAVENMADATAPGLGGDIYSSNRNAQTLLAGEEAGIEPVKQSLRVPSLSGKYIANLAKDYAREISTGAGLAGSNLPPWFLQGLRAKSLQSDTANQMRQPPSPWLQLLQENQK